MGLTEGMYGSKTEEKTRGRVLPVLEDSLVEIKVVVELKINIRVLALFWGLQPSGISIWVVKWRGQCFGRFFCV